MIIELYSGIGRFQTEEQVIYISNDIRTKPTVLADVRFLPLKKNIKPRLLHGSPPCRYISKARSWRNGYNFQGLAESFRLYAAFFDAVDWLRPENITFESPENIEKYMKKIKFFHVKYDIKAATTNLYFFSSKKQMKRSELSKETRRFI